MKWENVRFCAAITGFLLLGWLAFHQYQRAERLEAELVSNENKRISPHEFLELPNRPPSEDVKVNGSAYNPVITPNQKEIEYSQSLVDAETIHSARKTVMQKPIYQRAYELKRNSEIIDLYDDFLRQIAPISADLNILINLLAERRFVVRDVALVSRESGMFDAENTHRLIEQTSDEIESDLRELLGSSKFEQLQEYEKTTRQRELIGELESRLSYSDAPLNPKQSAELFELWTRGNVADAGFTLPRRVWRASDDDVTQAQSTLSSAQIETLKVLLEEQFVDQTLNRARAEIDSEIKAAWESKQADDGG